MDLFEGRDLHELEIDSHARQTAKRHASEPPLRTPLPNGAPNIYAFDMPFGPGPIPRPHHGPSPLSQSSTADAVIGIDSPVEPVYPHGVGGLVHGTEPMTPDSPEPRSVSGFEPGLLTLIVPSAGSEEPETPVSATSPNINRLVHNEFTNPVPSSSQEIKILMPVIWKPCAVLDECSIPD